MLEFMGKYPLAAAIHDNTLNLLLISDASADARRATAALGGPIKNEWCLEQVALLSDGIKRLKKKGIAAVLLDLYLPDSQGIRTFDMVFKAASQVPILVLANPGNKAVARQATHRGARDHLQKKHVDAYWLPRILNSVLGPKAAENALLIQHERALVILNSIGDAVLSIDVAGNISYLNPVAEDMTGWLDQEARGRPVTEVFQIIDGATRQVAPNPMAQAIQENRAVTLTPNCVLIRRDGFEFAIEDSASPIHDRTGEVTGAVIVFRDVSVARANAEKISHSAQHDFLTDLPNPIMLRDRIENAITLARRHGKQGAVLFIDLDRFKDINDARGHTIGDKLLQSVAQRLGTSVRSSDTVSRLGGDEFAVLLSEIEHAQDASFRAENILLKLAAPYDIAGEKFNITASIGISIYPDDGENAESLIRRADIAMYHAKHQGRNNYQAFTENMEIRVAERQFV